MIHDEQPLDDAGSNAAAAWNMELVQEYAARFERVRAFHACTQRLPRAWAMLGATNAMEAATHAAYVCAAGAPDRALYELANQAYFSNNYHLAYNIYTAVWSRSSEPLLRERCYFMLLRLLPDMKRYDECIRLCKRVMAEYPDHWLFGMAASIAAFACEQEGRYEQAITYLTADEQQHVRRYGMDNTPHSSIDFARCYLHLGRYHEALEHVNKGLEVLRYDARPQVQFTRTLLEDLKKDILARSTRHTTSPTRGSP